MATEASLPASPTGNTDPSHILFGSDLPFAPEPITAATVKGLNTYDGFAAQARAAIERDNGLRLFPRLRAV